MPPCDPRPMLFYSSPHVCLWSLFNVPFPSPLPVLVSSPRVLFCASVVLFWQSLVLCALCSVLLPVSLGCVTSSCVPTCCPSSHHPVCALSPCVPCRGFPFAVRFPELLVSLATPNYLLFPQF